MMLGRRQIEDRDLIEANVARAINSIYGPIIAPWEVAYLDDSTIEAALSPMTVQAPGISKIEAKKQAIRMNHPTFKNRANRIH